MGQGQVPCPDIPLLSLQDWERVEWPLLHVHQASLHSLYAFCVFRVTFAIVSVVIARNAGQDFGDYLTSFAAGGWFRGLCDECRLRPKTLWLLKEWPRSMR
jgi:hypothetical protein